MFGTLFSPQSGLRRLINSMDCSMSQDGVIASEAAGRYANALLDLAGSATALKTLEKDAKSVKAMFAANADLRRLVDSPIFAAEDKASALVAVMKKAKVSTLMQQFVGTVAQNRRAAEIPSMLTSFQEKLAVRRGATTAVVTSAKTLTAAELKAMKAELKKSLGRTVDIETKVDPDLLGGFSVKIGSRLFDNSLKTQLDGLKLAMKEV